MSKYNVKQILDSSQQLLTNHKAINFDMLQQGDLGILNIFNQMIHVFHPDDSCVQPEDLRFLNVFRQEKS